MGILDKLLSKKAQKDVSDFAKQAGKSLTDALNALSSSVSSGSKAASPAASSNPAPAPASYAPKAGEPARLNVKRGQGSFDAPAVGSDVTDRGSAEYFADLINKNLPLAEVVKNAPLVSVGASVPAKNVNISLLLIKAGSPALAIFLVPKSAYKRAAVINSMNACEAAGVPALRFMQEFSNEPGYVIGRIKSLI